MNPVEPRAPHENAVIKVFAKDQPEYTPLPASVDPSGLVMTEWEFSAEDLAKIVDGGRLRLWLHTFNQPLQPIIIEVVHESRDAD